MTFPKTKPVFSKARFLPVPPLYAYEQMDRLSTLKTSLLKLSDEDGLALIQRLQTDRLTIKQKEEESPDVVKFFKTLSPEVAEKILARHEQTQNAKD